MTDRELRRLRVLPGEIRQLEEDCARAWTTLQNLRVHSAVQASGDREPYQMRTVTVSGWGRSSEAETARARWKKVRRDLQQCREELARLNAFIDSIADFQTRRVFELRYRDGKTLVAVAMQYRKSEGWARHVIREYLKTH